MGKYTHYFESQSAYTEARDNSYLEPWVSYTEGKGVDYNKSGYEKLLCTPLTFEVTGDGNIIWIAQNCTPKTIEYKKNNGEWTSITANTEGVSISVVSGDTVQFRGDNTTYGDNRESQSNSFYGTTCQFKVKGNIMSMISSAGFATATTLQDMYNFNGLFIYCTGLTDASKLIMPATTLTYCCYYGMFYNCTSLVNAPELPATTLEQACYQYMFRSCTSLTKAPELPATTILSSCYYQMFCDCASLNYIKCLATRYFPSSTTEWVEGVGNTGTFVKSSNMSGWTTGADGIPSGWTVVDA